MRRANGEGSIFKLSGKRKKPWAVRITVGYTNEGKQKFKYLSYHISKTEAKAALREYLVNPYEIKDKITFAEAYHEWIKKHEIKASTMRNYRLAFDSLTCLHRRPIADITLKELENAISTFIPTAQARMAVTIRHVFKHAMKYEYIIKNPSLFLEPEKHVPQKKINIFTPAEIEELWQTVGTKPYDDMPLFLLYSGLRISELLNIKTSEVDLENKTFNITDSKTKNGIRILPIHHKIFPLIQKRYKEGTEYLIRTRFDKSVSYQNFIKYYWHIDHTRHEARHTFVSYLTKCTNDRTAIKFLVGHSRNDITDHYTHRTLEELTAAINLLEYK